jgi:hypothetical protein
MLVYFKLIPSVINLIYWKQLQSYYTNFKGVWPKKYHQFSYSNGPYF